MNAGYINKKALTNVVNGNFLKITPGIKAIIGGIKFVMIDTDIDSIMNTVQ